MSWRIASRTNGNDLRVLGYERVFIGTLDTNWVKKANWRLSRSGSVTFVLKVFRSNDKKAPRSESLLIVTVLDRKPGPGGVSA